MKKGSAEFSEWRIFEESSAQIPRRGFIAELVNSVSQLRSINKSGFLE
jgi:hypothetical protein